MKKVSLTGILLIFALSVTGIVGVLHPLSSAKASTSDGYVSLYSKTNPPEFYGLTKAVIQKGTDFDVKKAQFRIFAKDFEDGDLTPDIKVVSNNVNTAKTGNYSVKYKVTDSHGNSASITVPIEVVSDDSGNYYERTLYSLPSDLTYMTATGPRGMSMDRQITGFMLRANATINMKLISGAGVTAQVFSRLAGSKKNVSINKSEYQAITYTDVSTILMKTPYNGDTPTVIGIQVPSDSDVVEMPYYHYKDDEDAFREYWKSLGDDTVGVIESGSVMFHILPTDDAETGFKRFSTIDSGLEYFDIVFDEYDALQGYEYDASEPWNQNVKMKYFLEGGGANNSTYAYYTNEGVVFAQNKTPTSNAFGVGWAIIHEIGHGYQGNLKDGGGMVLNEVSNNMFGYYVQNRGKASSLFGGANWLGKISGIEESYAKQRESGKGLTGNKDKLYFFVELFDLNGYMESYAALCRNMREWSYKGEYTSFSFADKCVLTFYQKYHLNVSSYFEAWNVTISADAKAMVSDGEAVSILKDAVVDSDTSTKIRDDLGVEGLYSLVTQSQLDEYGLEGKVKVTLNIDDISTLIGKKIYFSNGLETYSKVIKSKEVTISLPVGSYQITSPVPINNIYNYTSYTSAVCANGKTNSYEIDYTENVDTVLTNDSVIELWGQGYGYVSKISFTKDELTVRCGGAYTHGYFSGNYITVEILDENDNVVLNKEYAAAIYTKAAVDTIPYKVGYKIRFYHAEGKNRTSRTKIYHSISGATVPNLDIISGTNTLIIGKYGLYQNTDEATNYQAYKDAIDEYANQLISSYTDEEISDKKLKAADKVKLLTSINQLKEADKEAYKEKYNYLYNGSSPTLNGNTVTLEQNSSSDIYSLLKGEDLEDGTFSLDEDNFSYDEFGTDKPGTYQVGYSLKDLDNNVTKGELTVTVNEQKKTAQTISYTIRYWKQNLEDDGYTMDSEETKESEADKKVYPNRAKYTGFITESAGFVPEDGDVIDVNYDRKICFVEYDGNGSDAGALPQSLAYKYGTKITLPEAGVTREGYEFAGWGEAKLLPGAEYELTGDVTFKAQWKELEQTVTPTAPTSEPTAAGEETEQKATTSEPIKAAVVYSSVSATNKNVTATVVFNREATSIQGAKLTKNDDGSHSYTFTENGTKTITFKDSDGNVSTHTLEVNWIDKEAPTAQLEYSTTSSTTGPVTVSLKGVSSDARVVNNRESETYTFEKNGEFEFVLKDTAGNESKIKATVDWIKDKEETAEADSSSEKSSSKSSDKTTSKTTKKKTTTSSSKSSADTKKSESSKSSAKSDTSKVLDESSTSKIVGNTSGSGSESAKVRDTPRKEETPETSEATEIAEETESTEKPEEVAYNGDISQDSSGGAADITSGDSNTTDITSVVSTIAKIALVNCVIGGIAGAGYLGLSIRGGRGRKRRK